MSEYQTNLIADNEKLIGQMRNHIAVCVNDTKPQGINWSFIDKEWALFDFLAWFAPLMAVKDAREIVKYVMEGEHE